MAKGYRFDGQGNRKRLFPMPVEAIIDHPRLIMTPTPLFGAVMRLLLHYWASECEPLPEERLELQSIGRMPERMMRDHGDFIRQVVADLLPALDKYYAVRVSRATVIKELQDRSKGVRALKAMNRSDAEVEKRMGQGDLMIPRKLTKRTDRPPPVIAKPSSARKRRTG